MYSLSITNVWHVALSQIQRHPLQWREIIETMFTLHQKMSEWLVDGRAIRLSFPMSEFRDAV